MSAASHARDYAVALDGPRMTFECGGCGHHYVVDFRRKAPAKRIIGDLRMMLKYWSRPSGTTAWARVKRTRPGGPQRRYHCPRCRRGQVGGKPAVWSAGICWSAWRATRGPNVAGEWAWSYGVIFERSPKRPVTCAACGQPIASGAPALRVLDSELAAVSPWAPRQRFLHREPCVPEPAPAVPPVADRPLDSPGG